MFKEELEMQRHNVTPAQFAAMVRYEIRKHNFNGIEASDIDLKYWAAGNDLNFDVKHNPDDFLGCIAERSISKPYEMQTYMRYENGSVYNMIMEFNFWDEKSGTGYFYYINKWM